jgi:L-galactose dehydrogenase/L-glyceraldehyde 3-phosphate reductase
VKYRTLGRTGLKTPEIGFGCGNVGGMMVCGDYEDQVRAVRQAMDLGINYFDTAAAYGDGKSEENLGMVLREIGTKVTLATKIRHRPEDVANLKEATIAYVEQSLKRLQNISVDLIQLHTRVRVERGEGRFALTPNEILGPGGVLEAFKSLREQGKVRYFGFSGLGDPEALHALVESGEFHSIQAYYNLLNPSAGQPVSARFSSLDYGGLIDHAAAKGMGVVVIRVLAAGALTASPEARGSSSREPLSPGSDYTHDAERAQKLGFLIHGDIKTLSHAAIRFALMKSEVSIVLVGFSNREHIKDAVDCSGTGELSGEAMARLKQLWNTDFLEVR